MREKLAALLLVLTGFTVSTPAFAVVGSKASIPRISVLESTEIYVFKDHRSRVKFRGAYKIQTSEGEVPKMRILSFDKNEMRLNSFKAWTMTGDTRTDVPSNMQQWVPVAEETGFSSFISLEVAFPRMNVGAVVHWEYEIEETTIPVLGFFSYLYRLDSDFHTAEGFELKIRSEVPLYFVANDPDQVLIQDINSRSGEFRLKKSLSHYVVNENYGILSSNRFPTVLVSTSNDWAAIGKELQKKYEIRLKEPLSPLLVGLIGRLRQQKGFFAQVREMNRLLGIQIRYMGDWRGRHSGQVPRSIAAISESQFGDCKDFSLLATKILRELGYEANFASVYSDRIPVPDFYYKYPNNYFNHQIVHVKLGKAQYWIDPTSQNDLNMVDETLASRKALVWGKTPTLRKIPGYTDQDNGFKYKLTMTPLSSQRFSGDLEIESWGFESKFARDDANAENPMLRWMMIFFPDVKATSQEFHTHSPRTKKAWAHRARGFGTFEDLFDKTPIGDGLRLGYSGFLRALGDVDGQWISDFDFGFPSTRSYEVEFKNRNFMLSGGESCSIKSPWLKIQVSVRNAGKSAFLTYTENFRTTEIPNAKINSNDFRSLQSQIKSCLASRVLVLRSSEQISQQKRGLASERVGDGMNIQLKRSGASTKTTKYYPKALMPIKNPIPKRVVADENNKSKAPLKKKRPSKSKKK